MKERGLSCSEDRFLHFVEAHFRGNLQVIRGFSAQVMSKMCGGVIFGVSDLKNFGVSERGTVSNQWKIHHF